MRRRRGLTRCNRAQDSSISITTMINRRHLSSFRRLKKISSIVGMLVTSSWLSRQIRRWYHIWRVPNSCRQVHEWTQCRNSRWIWNSCSRIRRLTRRFLRLARPKGGVAAQDTISLSRNLVHKWRRWVSEKGSAPMLETQAETNRNSRQLIITSHSASKVRIKRSTCNNNKIYKK